VSAAAVADHAATARTATVRREVRIRRAAADVWALAGDPARVHHWFPGMVAVELDGRSRTITTASGLTLPEEIVTIDPILRRFQYRLVAPIVRHHLGTIDVFDLGDGTSLVSYATDCDPGAMALVIGGATGAALRELRRQLEET
jgi:hypothetical protein